MNLKKLPYDLTVCKIRSVGDIKLNSISISSVKRMMNYHWYAVRMTHRLKQSPVTMDGVDSVLKECLIFH